MRSKKKPPEPATAPDNGKLGPGMWVRLTAADLAELDKLCALAQQFGPSMSAGLFNPLSVTRSSMARACIGLGMAELFAKLADARADESGATPVRR